MRHRWLVFIGLALSGGAPLAGPISSQGAWQTLGTHPDADAQPSSEGQELRALQPFDGKLYAGYGDENWNDNEGTGPIAVTPYDPRVGDFVHEFSMPAEAIDHYVVINDRLYIPNVDHHPEFSSYDSYAVGLAWQLGQSAEHFVHAYDIATLDGTDLYLVGGYGPSGASAKVERSLDDGATWEVILSVEPSGNYARFYCAGVLDGRLYVQADEWGSLHAGSKVYDGDSWSDGPRIPFEGVYGQHSVEFAGKMVFHGQGGLTAFDGASSSVLGTAYQDFFVDGDLLYYLKSGGEISYTEDLESFTVWGSAPGSSRSIAVLDGVLYVGDAYSRLHRFLATAPPDAGTTSADASAADSSAADVSAADVSAADSRVDDAGVALDSSVTPDSVSSVDDAGESGDDAVTDGGCGCATSGESWTALAVVCCLLIGRRARRRPA